MREEGKGQEGKKKGGKEEKENREKRKHVEEFRGAADSMIAAVY
jgi:hypothetical protein